MLSFRATEVILLALLLILAATSSQETDMLSQFRAGKLLCTNPDPQTKTCSTIDRLTIGPDGTMTTTGETLIVPDKSITLQVTSAAHFEAGAICGVMGLDDLKKGIVRADGSPLPPDRNALVLERLKTVFQPLAGQKICEGLRLNNGQLQKIGQAERVDLPLPGKPVRWIGPDEGYRVAPRLP
jgi:hypothetical protein